MDVTILLVEDSPTDAAILSAALDDVGCQWPIQIAQTGDDALALLGQIDCRSHVHPQLILLDLNLPGKTGHEVLREIKRNEVWQAIPTIVLSSSATPNDIYKSYQLHANAYITKPTNFSDYQLMAQKIYDFWLKTAQLPART
ncbi:response regulator [Leptothoe sp. PORK10 BA2]|jgi:two-component system, chemotaxis family, response regulator Rcp1|uniref:response regulator n=1 Tax=Leptothoe sp. PORK10 BA2 TaxID=3110254 RepID=UPI002B204771|nr:response regulator [Leptothoe sp. PORK10 BA2]MEA5465901.1 response regulator [Leptothoe sp. PORK10 BA2]